MRKIAIQDSVGKRKLTGAHYTPALLAGFVAQNILKGYIDTTNSHPIRILDPAVGDGELLNAILGALPKRLLGHVKASGYDTSKEAVRKATLRLQERFSHLRLNIIYDDFLGFVQRLYHDNENESLFKCLPSPLFDIVIANPPYVRTQVMGAKQSQALARSFGLSGRVDLYYAFIGGIARVLKPGGIAGIIVSNRFMTTKAGSSVRTSISKEFDVLHIWDLGDTRLFEAAVLPAVLLLRKKSTNQCDVNPKFTSIYLTADKSQALNCNNVIAALSHTGVVEIAGGGRYIVKQGTLDYGKDPSNVWRIATKTSDKWLATVQAHTYCTFGDIGKVRVGVKTTADKVFIRSDWEKLPVQERPELLRPLVTHNIARRYKALQVNNQQKILYTHQVVNGKRMAVNLDDFPRTLRYLNHHRSTLESRKYVLEAGRNWFEIWVPQDPDAWDRPKIIFRDIAESPTFWMDLGDSVVNGDCYWLTTEDSKPVDLLWLALAIGNSSFIEEFYDHRFHNKLYAGRRRFMTQYVEQFPLPTFDSSIGKKIIETAKAVYDLVPSPKAEDLKAQLDKLVWLAFGLPIKERAG